MIMIVSAWQRPERLALGMGFGKLMSSIETSMFYRNASNYHLIDVVTTTDTRRGGHMVFLTKLTDRWSSNLSFNDMH